jgi:hypothetical protein
MKELDFDIESLAFEVPVKLRSGKVVTYNIQEELAISEETLTSDFMEQAGKYAWWSTLAEHAKAYRDTMEVAVDKAEAIADTVAREELDCEGIKVTEGAVKQRIKLNEEYLEAVANFNQAKKNASILDKIVKAFEHRKDMLMVVGSHLRDQKDNSGDLRSLKSRAGDITNR